MVDSQTLRRLREDLQHSEDGHVLVYADDLRAVLGAESCECQGCTGFVPCCDRDTIHQGCGRCADHCWCVLCACGVLLERRVDQVRGVCAACFAAGAAEIVQ